MSPLSPGVRYEWVPWACMTLISGSPSSSSFPFSSSSLTYFIAFSSSLFLYTSFITYFLLLLLPSCHLHLLSHFFSFFSWFLLFLLFFLYRSKYKPIFISLFPSFSTVHGRSDQQEVMTHSQGHQSHYPHLPRVIKCTTLSTTQPWEGRKRKVCQVIPGQRWGRTHRKGRTVRVIARRCCWVVWAVVDRCTIRTTLTQPPMPLSLPVHHYHRQVRGLGLTAEVWGRWWLMEILCGREKHNEGD